LYQHQATDSSGETSCAAITALGRAFFRSAAPSVRYATIHKQHTPELVDTLSTFTPDESPSSAPVAIQWQVYILRCSDDSFYTGITNNLDRRLKQHLRGTASRYTRSRLPVELLYSEPQADHSSALKREFAIKQLPRKEKERLIHTPADANSPPE